MALINNPNIPAPSATSATYDNLTLISPTIIDFSSGITDDSILQVDGADLADNEYARMTANGVESRTASEVLTDLLTQTLVENDAIKLDAALSANGKYNGITVTGVAGATLAFGDIIYLSSVDSRWELADASAEATTKPHIGICILAAAADGDATNILLIGTIRAATFPAMTIGAPMFISETAGDITGTAPVTSGSCTRVVGHARTASELWFSPDGYWQEHV